jgi:CMP-2-keto-3-deoxyoctulosonic acid synthetase
MAVRAVMSRKEHESGSDRIAEAAADMDADIIVNVQGDTPFIKKEPLQKLLNQFNDSLCARCFVDAGTERIRKRSVTLIL